jgi:hypothetical protein
MLPHWLRLLILGLLTIAGTATWATLVQMAVSDAELLGFVKGVTVLAGVATLDALGVRVRRSTSSTPPPQS